MFKTWNFVDCGLTKGSTGHQYWETKALADEVGKNAGEARVFCHKGMSPDGMPGIQIYPIFPVFYYMRISVDPNWAAFENFVLHNRLFQRALAGAERALFRNSITVFPTMSSLHLLAVTRWLATFGNKTRPKTVVVLYPTDPSVKNDLEIIMLERIWKTCPEEVRRSIALCVRRDGFAERCTEIFGERPHVLPSALVPADIPPGVTLHIQDEPDEPMLVTYVGGARHERGGLLIPDVVKGSQALNARFFIQAKGGFADKDFDIETLTGLRGLPNVQLHEGLMEPCDYYQAIADGVVLLPYQPERYRLKSSGVYVEAKSLGAPVIVPAGTWMADDVEANGNGLVFDEYSAASIVECLARTRRELPELRKRARSCAKDFRQKHGPARCLAAMENAVTH